MKTIQNWFKKLYSFWRSHVREAALDFDCDPLQPGDRVFDLDADPHRLYDTNSSFGVLIKDTKTPNGFSIKWDDGEITPCFNPSRLLKITKAA